MASCSFDAAQECRQIKGQGVQRQPHIVFAERLARQPCPVEGVFALLDVLLGGAELIVKPQHPIRLRRQVATLIRFPTAQRGGAKRVSGPDFDKTS